MMLSLNHNLRLKPAFLLIRYASSSSKKSKDIIHRIIRVDHAGELGADRIYAGQMAVLGNGLFFWFFMYFMIILYFF